MPRLTIKINGQPITVYQKSDPWHAGMYSYRSAERSLDDDGPGRLVQLSKGYYQSEYLLEENTLIVTWNDDVEPETIADLAGPEPSMSWAKGTITSTTGKHFQLEYKLSAHTPEQSEKVFRERLIEQAGKSDPTTDAKSEPVKPEAPPPVKAEPTAAALRGLHSAARALMQQATAAEQRANAAEKSPENRTCCENLSVLYRRSEGKPSKRWAEIAKRAIKVDEAGTEDAKGQPRFVATRTARDIRRKLKKGQSRETIEAQTAKALRTQLERNSNPPKRKRNK